MKVPAKRASSLLAATLLLASALVALAIAISPSAAASSAGAGAAAQAHSTKHVSYQGISFTYDTSLAGSVVGQTVPEQIEGQNVPWWEAGPEHIKFEFKDFIRPGWDPAIFVFPIKDRYIDLYPDDPSATDIWLNRVNYLRDVLASKAPLPRPGWRTGGSVIDPPFLPPINAAVIYIGQQRFMKFKSGEGVRYLAETAQDVRAIGVEDDITMYTFQGLTADGKFYVAARFPAFLLSGPPPTPVPSPSTDYGTWVGDYNQRVIQTIDQAKGSDFFPDLDKLDAIMASLAVGSPASPGMPRTGAAEHQGDMPAAGPSGVMMAVALVLALIAVGLGLVSRERKART